MCSSILNFHVDLLLESDLAVVLEEVSEISHKWYNVGLILGVALSTLGKGISITRRRWKLPEQWRLSTPMPSHSRMLGLPSTSSPANQPKTETQGIHAIAAVAPHTYPPTANLKMRLVMTAGRKATYRRYVVLRRSPNNNPR